MSLGLRFNVTGNKELQDYLEKYPKVARNAARMAINDTIRRGRRQAKQEILKQVNLMPSYVNKTRLTENLASNDNLTGSIVGRRRPTSLARFDVNQLYKPNRSKPGRKKAGLSVKVKRSRKKIPNAFLVNLKAGNQDGANQGLAIRVPAGKKPRRRFNAKPLYKNENTNVYLLYGPSIQQVFDDVAEDLQPELTTYLNREFRRQFGRLNRG
ncbi:hypothetical protein [Marinobacter nauticus]|uniref:Uncharacterized protein n=1 Tax=Marinobacter nauticus TaxID=2743 RepID=A0A833JR94_MARNT|nr:hypothetical protein [Marinobacter nauticus]KAE8546151.1 hypothetical protein F6453_1397 [Marinobacter nauticus]